MSDAVMSNSAMAATAICVAKIAIAAVEASELIIVVDSQSPMTHQ
ncbi:hypothetical protein TUM4445_04130 [Shewanella sp. MBTL60-112-B2]|nr:hypothetical protein TUM4444_02990 [Shewanella sp. MBTL60-112-B1]GIU25698.1 hypothetical protein TUM4445_04130 [Shewanella sp. MBTL60-112-B2]